MEGAKQIGYDGYVILRDMYRTIYGYLHIYNIYIYTYLIAVSYALLNMDGSRAAQTRFVLAAFSR